MEFIENVKLKTAPDDENGFSNFTKKIKSLYSSRFIKQLSNRSKIKFGE